MAVTEVAWSFEGDYFENCSCEVACPCLFSGAPPMTSTPSSSDGACDVPIAFHIDRGSYGDVRLDGLNAVAVARSPGAMADGNMQVAIYVDERADNEQRDALTAILSGAAGGPMGMLAPLVSEVLGVRSVPIDFRIEGRRRVCEIPDVMHLAVQPIPTVVPDGEMTVDGAHPFALTALAMAVGEEGSTYSDYGLTFDNSGKNGHYARIVWSNA
jgi:hypothetical protein